MGSQYDVKDERFLIIWQNEKIDIKIQSVRLNWCQNFFLKLNWCCQVQNIKNKINICPYYIKRYIVKMRDKDNP